MTKSEAGRLGGRATLARHGLEWLRTVGKKGGRPRARTYNEIVRRQQLMEKLKTEEVVTQPSLNHLKELWHIRMKSLEIQGVLVRPETVTERQILLTN